MKKYCINFIIKENWRLSDMYSMLVLTPENGALPAGIEPGQFVQVEIADSKNTFLRRPISVNFANYDDNELWLLVRRAGEGTATLIGKAEGETLNIILPLGHGFSVAPADGTVLLVGGGVGVAPLLYLGKCLCDKGVDVHFLLGARSAKALLELEYFKNYGDVSVTTEDGTMGEKGFVTQHSLWNEAKIARISCCGPGPMMKAVARLAREKGIECEVSLENVMACGLGACLCCVEDTVQGNVCVCKEGPVFNINQLKW